MKSKIRKILSIFQFKLRKITINNFFSGSNPRGNFWEGSRYYESIEDENTDSFFSGIHIYYNEQIPYNPDNPDVSEEMKILIDNKLKQKYILKHSKDIQKLSSYLCQEVYNWWNIIQIIWEIWYLKDFILALYRFDYLNKDILMIWRARDIEDMEKDKKRNSLIITNSKNIPRFYFLARELKNFIIILTEQEIRSESDSKIITLEKIKTNPFNYEQ